MIILTTTPETLEPSFMVGEICFKMMARGEAPLRAALTSTLKKRWHQSRTLRDTGCEIIRAEKASCASRKRRSELQLLLDFLRPGDTLTVTRIDYLPRSIKDLQDIVFALNL